MPSLHANLALDTGVKIFPNPATDFLEVKIKSNEPYKFVLLLNGTEGRLIDRQTTDKTAQANLRFDLKNLAAGDYTVTVSSQAGHFG